MEYKNKKPVEPVPELEAVQKLLNEASEKSGKPISPIAKCIGFMYGVQSRCVLVFSDRVKKEYHGMLWTKIQEVILDVNEKAIKHSMLWMGYSEGLSFDTVYGWAERDLSEWLVNNPSYAVDIEKEEEAKMEAKALGKELKSWSPRLMRWKRGGENAKTNNNN